MTVVQGIAAYISIGLAPDRRLLVFVPFLAAESVYAWWVLRRARALGVL